MERVILHSDCNSFYASVECLYHPEIRKKPVAVGGEPEHRHGIILTKNIIAKKYGVKTGEPLWKAKQKCPDLVIIHPNYPLYVRFSKMAQKIYLDYTDRVEPFGIDKSWLDVTGSAGLFGSGETVAQEIRNRIKAELGITVSVGVGFNKIFAKLASVKRCSRCGTDAGRIQRELLPVVSKPSGARFKNTAAGSFRCGQRADCRHPGKLFRRILAALQSAFHAKYSGSYTAERKRILCGPTERNLAGTFRPISPTARRTVVGAIRETVSQGNRTSERWIGRFTGFLCIPRAGCP